MTYTYHKTSREWVKQGERLSNNGHYKQALNAYDKAIQLDKSNAYAYGAKAHVLNKLQWYGEAIDACKHALSLGLHKAWVYNSMGRAYMEGFSNFEYALFAFKKAIEIDPRHYWAYYNKGVVYHRTRRYGLALEAYDQAIKIYPREARFYTKRNEALMALNDERQAVMAFNQAPTDSVMEQVLLASLTFIPFLLGADDD